MLKNYYKRIMSSLDEEWESFLNNEEYDTNEKESTKIHVDPKKLCSNLYISTKTKITYLDKPVDLDIFWKLPTISYTHEKEGIIKKQMKITCETKEEYEKLLEKQKQAKCLVVNVIKHIDDPTAHTTFKYVCKMNIGISKKDILCYKSKVKGAFYNCIVLILRVWVETEYKEVNVKIFNTGKLSFPGMLSDSLMEKSLDILVDIFKNIGYDINYKANKIETVLINSNFNCGFYINRDALNNLLKYKYRFNVNYDPCSYPGIQCKYNHEGSEISFMIFRTGSVLIVGKCEENVLYSLYEKIKNILIDEYETIKCKQNTTKVSANKTKKKKIKKKTIYIHD